jgi:phosphatidylinositol alpha-1,6-mannosyltransferase
MAVVARLTARVLADEGLPFSTLSLLDDEPEALGQRAGAAARGRRPEFIARRLLASHSPTIYDSLGVARAQSLLSWSRTPYALWLLGIEAWRPFTAAQKALVDRARSLWAISNFTRVRCQQTNNAAANAAVCWLGSESDDPIPRGDGEHEPAVTILARIDASEGYKGHSELIEAWPRVLSAIPKARLQIAGGGSGLESLRNKVRASTAAGAIDVLGFVAEGDLPALWRRTSVFAMPSRGEGFGLTYIEAMRAGLPVIASIHDAAPEVNAHGVTGYNVDLDRKDELADRIIELLSSPDLAARMGAAGLARWRAHFCFSAFRARFAPLLRSFVAGS